MVAEELKILIRAEAEKAAKELRDVEKQSKKTSKEMGSMKKLLKKGLGFAGAAVSIGAVTSALKSSVEAYKEQEQAEKQLSSAAERNPLLDAGSVESIKDFASELQNVSTIGDETSIRLASIAASSGRTETEIKKMTQAAADVSSAMGITMDAAMRSLNKSFGGMTGELGELVPELQNLSEEQLEAGEGVDLIRKKFDGAAEAMGDTATGEMQQLGNSLGDLQEQLGEATLSGLQPFISGLDKFVSGIVEANEEVETLNETMDSLRTDEDSVNIESLRKTRDIVRDRLDTFRDENGELKNLNETTQALVNKNLERLKALNKAIERAKVENDLREESKRGAEEVNESEEKLAEIRERAADKLAELTMEGLSQQERELQNVQQQINFWAQYKGEVKGAEQIFEALAEKRNKLRREIEGSNEAQEESNETDRESLNIGAKQVEAWKKRSEAMNQYYDEQKENSEKSIEQFQKEAEAVMSTVQTIYSAYSNMIGSLSELRRNQHEQELEKYDERIEKVNEQLQAELEAAGLAKKTDVEAARERLEEAKKTGDEEVIAKAEDELEKAKIEKKYREKEAQIEKEKEEKIRQFKHEQWEREKMGKMLQATINTAMAVTEVLTNPVLAATVATLGAAQVATIAAQDNPYRSGGVVQEPVIGVGQNSGESYAFGESGPEKVTPMGGQSGESGGGDVYLDGERVGKWLSRRLKNRRQLVPKEAVV